VVCKVVIGLTTLPRRESDDILEARSRSDRRETEYTSMKRIALAFVALALILSACQSVTENIAERVLEGVEGVDGVDIDTGSGQISIETEEGSATIGGGEIPAGFPIQVPDGYKVTAVFTSDGNSTVSLAYENGNYAEIEAFYDDWTASESSEWSKSTSSISSENGTLDSTSWSSNESGSFIAMSNLCLVLDASIDPENCVNVNLNTGSG